MARNLLQVSYQGASLTEPVPDSAFEPWVGSNACKPLTELLENTMAEEPKSLQQLLERLDAAAISTEPKQVSIAVMMEAIGDRSFGPLLLFGGLILASPLSGIPGMPTTMSLFVLLIALQLLIHKHHFWLPEWLLRRSISASKLHKATKAVRRPASFIDRCTRPRLTFFAGTISAHLIAFICVLVALGTPAMEVVPFSATLAGAALSIFGLSLIARDGLLVLLALAVSMGTLGLIIYGFVL